MLPILPVAAIRSAEERACAQHGWTEIDLMDRAATAAAAWLQQRFPRKGAIGFAVLCGTGNNGGDGLAIARLLQRAGHRVHVWLCQGDKTLKPAAAVQLERLRSAGVQPLVLPVGSALPEIPDHEVVIDALFGIGLDRPLTGWHRDLVLALNARANTVVSIDLPSGLFAEDNRGNDPQAVVQAEQVLTFACPKLALVLADNARYTSDWRVLDIGLGEALREEKTTYFLLEAKDMGALVPVRARFAHKGTFGHAQVIAGGEGKGGAAVLATRACLRSGAGLVTVEVPDDLLNTIHMAAPEAMVGTAAGADAVGIGPGIGTDNAAAQRLKLLLQSAAVPLVIDADAINLLSENRTWLGFLPKASILTPHPGEFDRLTSKTSSSFERLERAREFAMRHGVVLLLKGAYSAICAPTGKVYLNPTGNAGMARGGSGDALTGLLTGLLAQGLSALEAATLGAYVHGLAGDLAAADIGMQGMLVSELIDRIPQAWRELGAA